MARINRVGESPAVRLREAPDQDRGDEPRLPLAAAAHLASPINWRVNRDGRPAIVILQSMELLGDFVLHVPAYRALRFAFPDHWIVAAFAHTTQAARAFARVRPLFIDEIAEDQPIASGRDATRGVLQRYGPVAAVIDVRSNHHALWSLLASRGIAHRFAAAYLCSTPNGYRFERRKTSNTARFHRLVERVAGRDLPFDGHLPEMPDARVEAERLLPTGPRYLGMAPGPSASFKAWPVARHIDLANRARTLGFQPVFFIGPQEVDELEVFRRNTDALFISPSGAWRDLDRLPWLMHAAAGRLTACVAVDTGLGHLIASRQIPLITLSGPTKSYRWRPLTPFWWLLDARDFGSREMAAIPVDAVTTALRDVLRWNDVNGHLLQDGDAR